jgi:hypothetical protein
MTLEQYAYLAEIIGVIVIVATLMYLAIQTKQNTTAVQASVRQAILEADRESLRMVIEYPALNKRTNLTEEEEIRLKAYLIHFLRTREHHWLQYKNGVLDDVTWSKYRDVLVPVIFSSKFGRAFWASPLGGAQVVPDLVKHINEWIQGLDVQDSDSML